MLDLMDMDLYRFLSGANESKKTYYFTVAVVDPNALQVVYELPGIISPANKLAIIKSSFLYTMFPGVVIDGFNINESHFEVKENDRNELILTWEHREPWPWAYGAMLSFLTLLYDYGRKAFEELGKQGYDSIFSLGGRTLPRQLYSKYMCLGEYASGLVETPGHILEEIVSLNVYNSETNLKTFIDIGFDEGEANDLARGGFIGISDAMVKTVFGERKINTLSFGGAPVNENFAFIYSKKLLTYQGFYLDRYYQNLFSAFTLGPIGLYGTHPTCNFNYFRFIDKIKSVGVLRVKYNSVPIIEVQNKEELYEICNKIPKFTKLYFRGQTQQYYLERPDSIKRLLYGTLDAAEPSLRGAAPRLGWHYDEIHPTFQLILQDIIYEHALKKGLDLKDIHDKWEKAFVSLDCVWDRYALGIAQHYGIPTHGLDLTDSLDIALWFATNRLVYLNNGSVTYKKVRPEEWPDDPGKWPAVFVIQGLDQSSLLSIQDIPELEELGLSALRPQRQKACLFLGAHGIHQNRLAESIACVFRLRPGIYETGFCYSYLFPTPDQDEVYRYLLIKKSLVEQEDKLGGLSSFFNKIPLYV